MYRQRNAVAPQPATFWRHGRSARGQFARPPAQSLQLSLQCPRAMIWWCGPGTLSRSPPWP